MFTGNVIASKKYYIFIVSISCSYCLIISSSQIIYKYITFINIITCIFNYISSVDAVEVVVMQDSSYNIAMSPFDFLIFKYEFLSPEGSSTTDKDKMNN